uniref:Splicing factor, arginine/serine-rich, putative n=1 Tax=Arundo donax TaxID=35708 RepID=A0A0A9FSJ0_ARUDO
MDKKAKEEEMRQKEIIKGDPSIKKLSRRERRKASQVEREREREAARSVGRVPYRDPYREQRRSPSYEAYSRGKRSRSQSRSRSPSYYRRHGRSTHSESSYRSKPKPPKVEYITEFGGSDATSEPKIAGISPPSSPIQNDIPNRSENSTFNICKCTLGDLLSAGAYCHCSGVQKLTVKTRVAQDMVMMLFLWCKNECNCR